MKTKNDQPHQLSFDLPARPALGRESFFVSQANALAVNLIDQTLELPGKKLIITGPAGAGKSHLAHVWAEEFGGQILQARDLTEHLVPDLAQAPLAVEDVPRIAGNPEVERLLFHLHNLLNQNGFPLLMTGRGSAIQWGIKLPDLQSRIAAAASASLEQPDDQLLTAVYAKLFADRQLTPRADVIPFLLRHIDRSFDAAARAVDLLDRAALSARRNVTRSLATELLAATSPGAK